ncbi:MAG: serine/threonine protein kinase [Deltaproteobacteria bacterium]|nr:serine/threonine protein kinase [Deltaproteobacteria bacterium]
MVRASSLVALVAGVGGAVGLWLASAGTPGSGPLHTDAVAAADAIASAIREQKGEVHARAMTLAQIPRLTAAVGTDANTVRDLTKDELSFRPAPGETVELGQVQDGKAASLLRLPESSAVAAPLTKAGSYLMSSSGALMIGEVQEIMPEPAVGSMRGALAVSRTVDLARLANKLDKLGGGARLELAGGGVDLGKGLTPGATTEALPLTDVPGDAKLIVPAGIAAVPASVPLRAGAGGALAVGLVLAFVLGRKRGAGAAPVAVAPSATIPAQPAPASMQMAAAAPPPMRNTGSPFGRYAPMRLLGSGGMADVYLARSIGEAGFEKQVALKIMHSHLGRVEEAVAHFLDEARLASRLTHPNIVQIYDLGKNGEEYFIAMEYIDGSDLERLLISARHGGRRVPVPVALGILRKVCDGLQAAHTATDAEGRPFNLVHRDVKSANVLVSKDGAVKIGDFGIVKAEQQVHKTSVGQAKGTAAFMAPEQRMGSKVDARADVFGVGAMAYELLTGLEVNLDLVAMLQRGVEGWPHLALPTQVFPDLPPELDRVVFRALAFEADHRHPSCAALEDELAHVARQRGLVATDKEIALWLDHELALIPRATSQGASAHAPTSAA